jgi:hypothetical protein
MRIGVHFVRAGLRKPGRIADLRMIYNAATPCAAGRLM